MNPTQLLDYFAANPWAGWLLLGALSLLVSKKSQVDAWAESNPRVAGVMKLFRSLGIDPWMLLQSLSLIVRGKLPAAKVDTKDAPPPTPKSGSIPPAATVLLLAGSLSIFAPLLPACSSAQLPTPAQVDDGRAKTELVVALAGQAIPVIADELDRLIAAGMLTPAQADKARAGLGEASGMLGLAEAWLAGQADAPGRAEVIRAIDGAALAVEVIQTAGGKLPPVTGRAIDLAREVAEGK